MKTRIRKPKKFKRGSVLSMVVLIGIVLALLGIGMLKLGFGARVNAQISIRSIDAREAADAGIAHALYMMNQNFIPGGTWTDAMLPPDVNDMSMDNSSATFSYTIRPVLADRDYEIISTGKTDRQTRIVHALTYVTNLFDYGLIVTDSIVLKSNTFVDGYNSNIGPYGLGNSGGEVKIGTTSILPPQGPGDEGIILNNDVTVIGDVLVGIGGDPEVVIVDHGATTGPRYNLPSPFEFEDIEIPVLTTDLGFISGPNEVVGSPGLATYAVCSGIDIPATGDPLNPGVLNIYGEVYLRVTGDIRLGQGTELRVNGVPMDPLSWSSAMIYLDGDLVAGNSNGINNMTEKPRNFRLFGTGPETEIQNWNIKNSGDFFGVYYAPHADIIIFAKGEVFGSVSGKSFELKADPGSTNGLHYDVDLSNLLEYDTGFGILRWWEEAD